jgi:hypothetical protein
MKVKDLPKPKCEFGYPTDQLEEILGDRLKEFNKYMVGQTGSICVGQKYNRDTDKHDLTGCGPHGIVVYKCDLITFLEGRATLD